MAKTQIEHCLSLTASKVAKLPIPSYGTVSWGNKTAPLASITIYRIKDLEILLLYLANKQKIQSSIKFNTTLLPWDRLRYWFTCPSCERRVAHLHMPGYDSHFLCRHCHRLTYRSQQVNNRWSRMFREPK